MIRAVAYIRFSTLIILFSFILSLTGHGNNPSSHKHSEKNCFFKLGDKLLSVARHGDEKEMPFVLISLHSNETTAIDAAKNFTEKHGGLFLELLNYNQRLIEFSQGELNYTFDPNRIFTPVGRAANLQANKSYTKDTDQQVGQFANFILTEIPNDKAIIALHNNTDSGYMITDYKKGSKLERDAALVHHNAMLDADDFFLTTDPSIFTSLKAKNYNVVLQHNATVKDDGSLSVYCAGINRSYVNIETEHGHFYEQQKMLSALSEIIE